MAKKKKREAKQRHHKKSRASLSLSFSRRIRERSERGAREMLLISGEIFSLEESVFSLKCASEEYEAERDTDALFFVFFSVLFGSDEDAERRAEKTERG